MLGRLVGDVGGGGGLVEDLAEAEQHHHGDGGRHARPEEQGRVPGADQHEPAADDRQRRPVAQGDGRGQFQQQDDGAVEGDDQPEGPYVEAVVGEEYGEEGVLLAVDHVHDEDRAEQHQDAGARP